MKEIVFNTKGLVILEDKNTYQLFAINKDVHTTTLLRLREESNKRSEIKFEPIIDAFLLVENSKNEVNISQTILQVNLDELRPVGILLK